MAITNMKLKEDRIKKQIESIKMLYDLAFEMKSTEILNIKNFKLNIEFGTTESSLIAAGKLIFSQTQVLRALAQIHPAEKAYKELRVRLVQVHKQLMHVLKKEFNISNSQVNEETGEIDYFVNN